jgi:hypothetical protein
MRDQDRPPVDLGRHTHRNVGRQHERADAIVPAIALALTVDFAPLSLDFDLETDVANEEVDPAGITQAGLALGYDTGTAELVGKRGLAGSLGMERQPPETDKVNYLGRGHPATSAADA